MKKKIQKPFSIEAMKNGAKVETRDGMSVRILCTDVKNPDFPIVGLVMHNEVEDTMWWHTDGHWSEYGSANDLVVVEEVEEPERFIDNKDIEDTAFCIDWNSQVCMVNNCHLNNIENQAAFATGKLAYSAVAMARISQIIANDERFGGFVTDDEWRNDKLKFVIVRAKDSVDYDSVFNRHELLAFHTEKQRDLFLEENEKLVKQYLMID